VFKFMDISKDGVVALPVAAASPVAAAAEQQQENDDKQEQIHGIPPFRMRHGGIALPSVRYFVRVASGSIAC
jgi:hypothetical protein